MTDKPKLTNSAQSLKQPFFVAADGKEDLPPFEEVNINIPISRVLLASLNAFESGEISAQKVEALLDFIVSSSSGYLFPEFSMSYEPPENKDDSDMFIPDDISLYVPDDDKIYTFNWKAIVLQVHISLFKVVNRERLASVKVTTQSTSNTTVNIGTRPSVVGSQIGSQLGSLRRRAAFGAIGSLRTNAVALRPNAPQSFVSTNVQMISRESAVETTAPEKLPQDYDISKICDVSFKLSFEDEMFRGLVATSFAKGLLDAVFGNQVAKYCFGHFQKEGLVGSEPGIAPNAYAYFYMCISQSLSIKYDELSDWIKSDRPNDIERILDVIEKLNPCFMAQSSFRFVESLLVSLCYHEKDDYAKRAARLYTNIVHSHNWEPEKSVVSTCQLRIDFHPSGESTLLVSIPTRHGVQFITPNDNYIVPRVCGFYDYCYVKFSSPGQIEIDKSMPRGRYIVLPYNARNEVIHELPAFRLSKGFVKFSRLTEQLDELFKAGVTAVHVPGAIALSNRNFNMSYIADHSIINKDCGGIEEFTAFCAAAKSYGMRVLVDFLPVISGEYSSRKYTPFQVLEYDQNGRICTSFVPGSRIQLLTLRSAEFWRLLLEEIVEIAKIDGVSGFFLGDAEMWDYVLPRNMEELEKVDPDGEMHYNFRNILIGSIVDPYKNTKCGLMDRNVRSSPFLSAFVRRLWQIKPDMFIYMGCKKHLEPFVAESGIIPQNDEFGEFILKEIANAAPHENPHYIKAHEGLAYFYKERQRLPQDALVVAPFTSLTSGQANVPHEKLQLAIDFLFFLSDIPLVSSCLEDMLFVPGAYNMYSHPQVQAFPFNANHIKFKDALTRRATSRSATNWMLNGNIVPLKCMYDESDLGAVTAVCRYCSSTKRAAIMFSSFYHSELIFQCNISQLEIFQSVDKDCIIEFNPILIFNNDDNPSRSSRDFYSYSEVCKPNSTLLLDISKFSTSIYEINIRPPSGENKRLLMDNVFGRLGNALSRSILSVLANNEIFQRLILLVDNYSDEKLSELLRSMPPNLTTDRISDVFKDAFYATTRYAFDPATSKLTKLGEKDDELIMEKEKRVIEILKKLASSNDGFIRNFGASVRDLNKLESIFFLTPELGPFSKVGGLSTMVWELAKELVSLGVDVSVISPYYHVGPKGEIDYLKKWNVQYDITIDVYAPDKVEIGLHYAIIDGVKCWFMHNHSYFSNPYQTGSPDFRLRLLCLFPKACLELLCQKGIIPRLIVTNDWMTGLTAAYARRTFGNVFNDTKFLHIFHNLGVGYSGKIYPHNGDTGSLHYIHNLPDELICDHWDHSFDPSLSALLNSDQWATVSKKYRDELLEGSPYREYLHGHYDQPFAYSNGIRFKERLDEIRKLNMSHDDAKRVVQEKYFGYSDPNKCLFFFLGRIVEQKGVHLIAEMFEAINAELSGACQFVVGGQAAPDDHGYGQSVSGKLLDLKHRFGALFWADPRAFFNDGVLCSHGADFVLVPSLFEPSGIVQQEAFASGTPVVAFKTGGLADTVFEYDRQQKTGNGCLFWAHRHDDYKQAIIRAVGLFKDKETYYKLRENAYKSTLSTETVARAWSREFARLFHRVFDEEYERQLTEKRRASEQEYFNRLAERNKNK